MKLTQENIIKRLRNWKTIVALFALVGMVLDALGYTHFEGELDKWESIVYTAGILLGVWTDHEPPLKEE